MEVFVARTKYPQGAEKTLIKRVMGRKVPSGGLPADVGVVVDNISTVKAISDAIQTGMPLVERVATVTGEKIKNPGNFIIKIGTSVRELIDYCGGFTDDDVLESGIRIIAQPPGKKLQNMMQLSGGEKALTAISLLFAIQNLKPSPFCLLDEIEAALDDSNVTRFAKYLHKLTKDTQFIVITHRRGTMMAADVLYGITMQEKGISTQVSVNLIENDLDE